MASVRCRVRARKIGRRILHQDPARRGCGGCGACGGWGGCGGQGVLPAELAVIRREAARAVVEAARDERVLSLVCGGAVARMCSSSTQQMQRARSYTMDTHSLARRAHACRLGLGLRRWFARAVVGAATREPVCRCRVEGRAQRVKADPAPSQLKENSKVQNSGSFRNQSSRLRER